MSVSNRITKAVFVASILAITGNYALAQSSTGSRQTTVTDETNRTTTVSPSEYNTSGLNNEMVGISPQVGMLNFRSIDGANQNRGLVGLTVDVNGTGFVNNALGRGTTDLYSGITLGALYSHLGAPSSNFFGSPNDSTNDLSSAGANLLVLPLNVKVGYNLGNFLVAAHGGGNVFYQSMESGAALGVSPSTSSDSGWSILPNVGVDLQYGVVNKIAVLLRPDWTIAGSNSVLSATLGATMPI